MEVVSVHAQVEDVERALRRPAVLVREGDRGEPVLLHLFAQRLEGVPVRRDLVALGCPQVLAIEDRPRVVVGGHRICVAVVALDRRGEAGGVVALHRVPDVVDRRGQSLVGEEPHAVAGEPGENVLRRALQVRRDLVLERAVVDRVDVHLGAAVGRLEGVDDGLHAGFGAGV